MSNIVSGLRDGGHDLSLFGGRKYAKCAADANTAVTLTPQEVLVECALDSTYALTVNLPLQAEAAFRYFSIRVAVTGAGGLIVNSPDGDGTYTALGTTLTTAGQQMIVFCDGVGYTVLNPAAATIAASINLNDLADVNTSGVTTNQTLKYTGSGWVDGSVAITELSGVTLSNVATGQVLKAASPSSWTNQADATA